MWRDIVYISDLDRVGGVAGAPQFLILGVLSLVGLPPSPGFWGKLILVATVLEAAAGDI